MNKNMLNPAISIVMPFYNTKKYLRESIDSILTQTFRDFELLLIDDGSTDNSLNIISLYDDERIRLIRNTHDFIKSLNLGIAESRGKYIARMDSDDIMLENRLAIQYNFMENNPDIDICGSWMETFGGDERIVQVPIFHKDIMNLFFHECPICHPTVMMRKKSIQGYQSYPNLYLPDYIYAEDYKLWLDLIIAGFRFVNIPKPLIQYRLSESQVTCKYGKESIKKAQIIKKDYLRYALESIIKQNENLFEYINKSINLVNERKISVDTFKQIVQELLFSQSNIYEKEN